MSEDRQPDTASADARAHDAGDGVSSEQPNGHILPVELLSEPAGIGYTDARLLVRLQSSLGNRIRLWNLDAFGADLERLAEDTTATQA